MYDQLPEVQKKNAIKPAYFAQAETNGSIDDGKETKPYFPTYYIYVLNYFNNY